ncbi:hypothetical protein Ahu01nite_079160 [Winogradskya humida]|uniref:Uncharacterized protein n=1 Tax=Winogradskya humida TaxID=113566 RepID=A0ABQ4A1U0_9ACTN|nr:hypothetical protein Ahu01nite_079160 [Actinoplanes humidus]
MVAKIRIKCASCAAIPPVLSKIMPSRLTTGVHTVEDLPAAAADLNKRPRKIPGWDTLPSGSPDSSPKPHDRIH